MPPALPMLETVEALLSSRFGAPIRVLRAQRFPHYPQVTRCALEAAGAAVPDLPDTVVVRVLRDGPARSGVARLHNERAALEFLESIGSSLAPRFIAGDGERIFVSEDLGTHPSLLDLLLGSDAAAARRGLLAFARGLGLLHAQTAGRAAVYHQRRARLDPADDAPEGFTEPGRVEAAWRRVRDVAAQLGLPPPRGAGADVEAVVHTLTEPGRHVALSSGDPGPANCKIAGDSVRFYDFEAACFHHALADAIVLRYPYPTGGPVWRVPPDITAAIERTYRQELAAAWPNALADAHYNPGMAAACAAWTIVRLERLPRVDAGPDRDHWTLLPAGWSAPIPTRSRRRQLVAIVETCIASARRAGTLQAFAAWCDDMVHALRARWPEASEETPLFPAFDRGSPAPD
ncbi:MAG: hypothetical protein AVDCRST_MAG77-4329 [uncultured Chloroflexi bacterium]|uniref:Aminoglycoside phosphotransferase domain-containing protein n=1 Tax=uncultured Chloroflexota bacterium TaxID=166587 RepID=A0A6J4JIF1_9CHLR|nr:MAG: hypothetical protein AVDCRST_MAG77-4329 [uncultured Chloroflexota bacterium]